MNLHKHKRQSLAQKVKLLLPRRLVCAPHRAFAGKYNINNKPGGPRGAVFNDNRLRKVEPVLGLMKEIGAGHEGKSPAQVAINWVICKGALPIPGGYINNIFKRCIHLIYDMK
jgi:diketogulonate reductase-like aldo/keto reductase